MQAVEFDQFGDPSVLKLRAVTDPVAGATEVLVQVRAAALNPKDVLLRKGKFGWLSGKRFPMGVGFDFAGVVLAGAMAPGTRVWGMLGGFRGRSVAEQLVARPSELAAMPDRLDFNQAAALPLVGLTALQALRDRAEIREGQRLLINGASGGLGLVAIQIGKLLGAHVTTLSSAANRPLCKRMGADVVLDYRVDEPLSRPSAFDVIFDVFGNRSLAAARTCLKRGGVYVTTVPSRQILSDQISSAWSRRCRAKLIIVKPKPADLEQLAWWVNGGKLKPVLDRILTMADVADGQRFLETKRARGKVVVQIGS